MQRIDLLASAAEAGVRVVFLPLDLTLTIFEAIDGDKAALLSLGLAATPIDNVLGFSHKLAALILGVPYVKDGPAGMQRR